MNLSAQEESALNEGKLISLTEEQLEQLRIIWTSVIRCVFACLCQV